MLRDIQELKKGQRATTEILFRMQDEHREDRRVLREQNAQIYSQNSSLAQADRVSIDEQPGLAKLRGQRCGFKALWMNEAGPGRHADLLVLFKSCS